jgi:hypothetical protein
MVDPERIAPFPNAETNPPPIHNTSGEVFSRRGLFAKSRDAIILHTLPTLAVVGGVKLLQDSEELDDNIDDRVNDFQRTLSSPSQEDSIKRYRDSLGDEVDSTRSRGVMGLAVGATFFIVEGTYLLRKRSRRKSRTVIFSENI